MGCTLSFSAERARRTFEFFSRARHTFLLVFSALDGVLFFEFFQFPDRIIAKCFDLIHKVLMRQRHVSFAFVVNERDFFPRFSFVHK